MVSDNAKTFENTAKWLDKWLRMALRDPSIVALLVDAKAEWKFNLSRSPWWGGFFERMVGLMKSVLYKMLGRAKMRFSALHEILLEVEVILNNRPLGYIENDIQLPVLTPHMVIHGTNVLLPEDDGDVDPDFNEPEPTKLAKHLKKCKDAVWCRWKDEYLRALREKHDCSRGKSTNSVSEGDIVLIKDDSSKNRGTWKLGLVTKLIQRDGVTLGAKLKTNVNTLLERSVKQLYPLELRVGASTDRGEATQPATADGVQQDGETDRTEVVKRSGRLAKSKAAAAIKSIVADEVNV